MEKSYSIYVHQKQTIGDVALIGFGPGDPELLTQKAVKYLERADIIFHDDLLDIDYLEKFNTELVYVGKRKGRHSFRQDHINELLYQAVLSGKNVVRLKGGDPLIFGRGAEEYYYLTKRHVDVVIVPGITSAMAAAASVHVPLTARGISSSVVFLSAHDLVKLHIPKAETLVFYMGATQQRDLAKKLVEEGWHKQTPAMVVRNASLPDSESRKYTLKSLIVEKNPLAGPAIIIVGYVGDYNSSIQPPRWVYTGIHIDDFKEHGIPVHSPMNEIHTLSLNDRIIDVLTSLYRVDRIIFTSRYAVRSFFDLLFKVGLDARTLNDIHISSIGSVTSGELKKNGILGKEESDDESLEGMIRAFSQQGISDETILVPTSDHSKSSIFQYLTVLGNRVIKLPVFNSLMPSNIIRHNLEEMTGVVFTSPKSVDHFLEFYESIPDHLAIRVRGKQTAKRLKQLCHQKVYEFETTVKS